MEVGLGWFPSLKINKGSYEDMIAKELQGMPRNEKE